MTVYEVIEFDRTFETDDDVEVVAAQMSAQGTRESRETASNFALVAREAEDDEHECGIELDGGNECTRTVESADATCWQHQQED